jgi:cytolysin-activating lysine-acyltransferase
MFHLLRQFRIFYKGQQPVGVALWALVDETVAKRIVRIIELVAPFGGQAEMCAHVGVI